MASRSATQAEVVHEWLHGESDSERFQELYGSKDALQKTLNDGDDDQKLQLLLDARGRLLYDFPWEEVVWQEETLDSKQQLGNLRTTAGLTWLALTEGSRKIADAARVIAAQDADLDPHVHVEAVRARIKKGEVLPSLIAFKPAANSPAPVLLEGHVRAIAYYLEDGCFPITYYVGSSATKALQKWDSGLNLEEIKDNFLSKGVEATS